jgi:hypothetical protein
MPDKFFIHPIAILGVVKKKKSITYLQEKSKRIVGSLLGYRNKNKISCTSLFNIPFEEEIDGNSWFIDHNFIEKMADMHKKVNTKESVIGWYSNSEKINKNDLNINQIFLGYLESPIQLLIWANDKTKGFFMDAFFTKINFLNDRPLFININVVIGLLESEEIGIFQILKNSNSVINLIATDSMENCFKIVRFYITHINKLINRMKFSKIKFESNFTKLKEFDDILNKMLPFLNQFHFLKKTKRNFFWLVSSLINFAIDIETNFLNILNKK